MSLIHSNVLGTRNTKKDITIFAFKELKASRGKQGTNTYGGGQLLHDADYVYDSRTSCLHLKLSIIPAGFY